MSATPTRCLGVFGPTREAKALGTMERSIAHWRVTTNKSQTVDEYGVLFRNLFCDERH